jgi:hypothetical protein
MRLLIENWRQYLTEAGLAGSQGAMDQWKSMSLQEKVEDVQQFFSNGQQSLEMYGSDAWKGYFELTLERYSIFSKYANDNIADMLKELLERLQNFKDQETKDKLINNIFSDGGSWTQVLELLRTL